MKTQHFLYYLLALTVLLTACDKIPKPIKKEVFSGYAQKGPFVNGSSVAIVELNVNLVQTGKTYHAAISDNLGSFNLNNIELISNYVELKINGYYYNEISGKTSVGPITLCALVDVEDISSANVNVLTHLEKPRVEYLVQQQKMSFSAAKQQAQREVLAIFGFKPTDIPFETLDLTVDEKLLAISCILQGQLSTGDIMQLMADIIENIKQDGKLDNELGWRLLDNAYKISPSEIRNNLIKKYAELGMNVTIPNFESLIASFINSGLYPPAYPITYPAKGAYGDNILSDEVTEIRRTHPYPTYYSMTADVPKGQTLKVVIEKNIALYDYLEGNWRPIEHYATCILEVLETGKLSDMKVLFTYWVAPADNEYVIIKYYENGATTPTKERTLQCIFDPPKEK